MNPKQNKYKKGKTLWDSKVKLLKSKNQILKALREYILQKYTSKMKKNKDIFKQTKNLSTDPH